MSHATLYAFCDINRLFTCLANERAYCLGGSHIHGVLCCTCDFQAHSNFSSNEPGQIVQSPLKVSFLESIDLMNFEGIVFISAKNLATFDEILQHVKKQIPFWRNQCRGLRRSLSASITLRLFGLDFSRMLQ